MLVQKTICAAGVLLALVSAFQNNFALKANRWSNGNVAMQTTRSATSMKSGFMLMMSDSSETEIVAAPSSSSGKKDVAVVDFSTYAVGQEYSGSLIGAKAFGVFVDIATGTNVLLPRSQMTKGNYEKLKRLADSKSKEQVKLELIGVSAENSTLSGKYLSGNYKNRPDLSALEGTDISSKFFNATVVGAHDFGLFAELDEYGVEGLVPASKLPDKMPAGSIQASYP
jgi:predicted RNA-binding protein with RPS1 domain